MYLADYHTHSDCSPDGRETIARMAEAAVARHPELVCMLGFMRRYDKSYAYAKEKIAAGAIGTPYLVKSTGIDPEAVVEGAIRYSGTSGGIFLDLSLIHI